MLCLVKEASSEFLNNFFVGIADSEMKRSMGGGYQGVGMYHSPPGLQMRFPQGQRSLQGMQSNGYVAENQDDHDAEYGSHTNSHLNNMQHPGGMIAGLNGYQQRINTSIPEEDLYSNTMHGANQYKVYGNVVSNNDQNLPYFADHYDQNIEYTKVPNHSQPLHDVHGNNSSPVNTTSVPVDGSLIHEINISSSMMRRTKGLGNMQGVYIQNTVLLVLTAMQ